LYEQTQVAVSTWGWDLTYTYNNLHTKVRLCARVQVSFDVS